MTGELGLENWTRELGPESWESWDQELVPRVGTGSWDKTVGAGELGPESWDHRVGRVGTRSWRWDKTVRTGELGLENWDRRVGTKGLGE